jgi:CMP-N,N'-diacetyllegionaminic acid synthase
VWVNTKHILNILAIIPARGGSKGIVKKNIRSLAGKPLIAYTIEEAKKSKFITKTVVSTDDAEIAAISSDLKSEVLIRPDNLAKDSASSIDVIYHVLEKVKETGFIPDVVVLLQPTSPLRTVYDIDGGIEAFLEGECDSLVSVCVSNHPPFWSFEKKGRFLYPLFGKRYLEKIRQDLPDTYLPNGAIFISSPSKLIKHHDFFNNKTIPYLMPPERSIDIDTEFDLMLAEMIILNRDVL